MAKVTEDLGAIHVDAFIEAVAAFRDSYEPMFMQLYKDYSEALFMGIVELTPVLTGRAKANWHVTLGSISDVAFQGTIEFEESDETGGDPRKLFFFKDNIEPSVQKIRSVGGPGNAIWDRTIYINNNVAYIQNLEEGSSTKAPDGMVAVTIEAVNGAMEGYVDGMSAAVFLEDLKFKGEDIPI